MTDSNVVMHEGRLARRRETVTFDVLEDTQLEREVQGHEQVLAEKNARRAELTAQLEALDEEVQEAEGNLEESKRDMAIGTTLVGDESDGAGTEGVDGEVANDPAQSGQQF